MSRPLIDLYQLRFTYTARGGINRTLTHKLQHWILPSGGFAIPGISPDDVNILTINGVTTTFTDYATNLGAILAPIFPAAPETAFISYELWAHPSDGTNPVFTSVNSAIAVPSNPSPPVAAQSTICTARTQSGRIAKIYLMETGNTNVNPSPINTVSPSSPIDDLFVFLTSADSCFVDRAGTRIIDPLQQFPGQNESLFKKRFRS